MTKGMRKISVKETSRRMLTDWNSTREMSILAPHHEFWPICWNFQKLKKDQSELSFLLHQEVSASSLQSEGVRTKILAAEPLYFHKEFQHFL